MPSFTTTLTTAVAGSTASNTSTAANLSWLSGKPTTVILSFSSSQMTANVNVQYTLDDIQIIPSTGVNWLKVASTAASTTVAAYTAAGWFDTGAMISFLNPIAAVRAYSTAISSGTVTMQVLQGEGW